MKEATPAHVQNGRIIRPGFYRNPDGSGAAYAKKVATGNLDTDCVFCPEALEARDADILEKIGSTAWRFYVIEATPAYAHFDAQRVETHHMLIPEAHIESERDIPRSALEERNEYLYAQEDDTPEHLAFEHYTRSRNNPSKSVGHLHTHLFQLALDPVERFSFDTTDGVIELKFAKLSDEERKQIINSRRA